VVDSHIEAAVGFGVEKSFEAKGFHLQERATNSGWKTEQLSAVSI
jgi:hypothetical protein